MPEEPGTESRIDSTSRARRIADRIHTLYVAPAVVGVLILLIAALVARGHSSNSRPTVPIRGHRPTRTSADLAGKFAFEGSVGVANVTAGDRKYGSSVLAADGDDVEFSIYGHNRETTKTISGLVVEYRLLTLDSRSRIFRVRFTGPTIAPLVDQVAVSPKDGFTATLAPEPGSQAILRQADIDGRYEDLVLATSPGTSGSFHVPALRPAWGEDAFTITLHLRERTK